MRSNDDFENRPEVRGDLSVFDREPAALAFPKVVDFGREVCGQLAAAEAREWLVTNGIGGFGCGTVAGTLTRRYHGLLLAALPPKGQRLLLAAKVDEEVECAGRRFTLGANRWASGAIEPSGYLHIERFRLEGTTPVWTFACAEALLEKRIWMKHGANTTYVQYTMVRGGPLRLSAKVLANYRGYHTLTTAAGWYMDVQRVEHGVCVQAFAEATPFYLLSSEARIEPAHIWNRSYELREERERGLDHGEDHLHAGTFQFDLQPGESVTLVATTQGDALLDGRSASRARASRERGLLEQFTRVHAARGATPRWIEQLVLAADQFVVTRPRAEAAEGYSIIAGYPWFGDWGRDAMIALPGLLLATGRTEIAAGVLRTYARFVDRGMLPNRFPDAGEPPEYNTVDAALWFFEAVSRYCASTGDLSLLRELYPALEQIIAGYRWGTRYHIHMDSADGLLFAGEPGVQLTWMDAKVGDWVVTPRVGKPVEVNALWLAALATQAEFAEALGLPAASYLNLAAKARQGFQRFWNPAENCCFDVIDVPAPEPAEDHENGWQTPRATEGPARNDASVRPNQILAVALPASGLTGEQQRAVVEACARELLTSFGLRSLSPRDPQYCGEYTGGVRQRDSAYHQGTAWGWLIGPFIHAVLRVTGNREEALSYLAPFENHLTIHGLGTASEIFDGDPPFTPRGCFAQAWTVAEVLRAWHGLRNTGHGTGDTGYGTRARGSGNRDRD